MKVGPTTESVRYLDLVQEKRDSGDSDRKSGQQHQQSSDQDEEYPEVFKVSDEKVGAALEAFRSDAQAQANGLHAQVEGQGPGLKVTLKDGSGAVVRQFTGEEFLKLREAASSGRGRGKILDQKI